MTADVAALVAAAKDGDRDAFDELVRVTYAEAYTLAFRLTADEEDARDVVQDAYLRAYKGLKRFRGDAAFATWLHRITANCAATHLAKRTKLRHEELNDETVPADDRLESDPVARADLGYERGRLNAALQSLPPDMRAVVVLRDIYDMPHEAIAAELGISEGAAKVRLHRARKRLRERLFPLRGDTGTEEDHAHAV